MKKSHCIHGHNLAISKNVYIRPDGQGRECKVCIKLYRKRNKRKYNKWNREWQKRNKDKYNAYYRLRRKNNIQSRLAHNLRKRRRNALKYYSISFSIERLAGCSLKELKYHLTKQFTKEMNWTNYEKVWEIDHIIPCSAFDLSNFEELQRCSHYSNLHPLLIKENRKKSNYF